MLLPPFDLIKYMDVSNTSNSFDETLNSRFEPDKGRGKKKKKEREKEKYHFSFDNAKRYRL